MQRAYLMFSMNLTQIICLLMVLSILYCLKSLVFSSKMAILAAIQPIKEHLGCTCFFSSFFASCFQVIFSRKNKMAIVAAIQPIKGALGVPFFPSFSA